MTDFANFLIPQGADWIQQIVLQNDDGSPMNLTDCQVHMQIRAFPGSPIVLLDLSTATGTITLKPYPAQINWSVPASQTAALQPQLGTALSLQPAPNSAQLGYYDLLIEYPGGHIPPPYMSGQVFLQLGITIPF
ncbi:MULTISPECIES: hypothetical protein [unclassified Burkholderia]|uniref:hypothetical protein n=1 Tax=unclassified Burkholderia TaxID=2613784 RepID=UPI000F57A241|nr:MULTISPECIES: hypothetical protein [unclassified Burkholderia]RQR87742.1 hypothetical protein DIE10_06560 [Burkholderia sp. Bp9011]RQR97085.1 hypothetical protein DIE09_06735 [Burkholderia sp. Bp9010]